MSDEKKSPDASTSSNSAMAEVLRNPRLTWTIVIIAALILLILTIIIVLAFVQGRKISIFDLEIEAAPTSQANALSSPSSNASQTTQSIPISADDFPGEVFDFSGNGGYGELHVINKANDDIDYRFYYEMPQSADAYAGIFFRFTPTLDFTEFAALQVQLNFSDTNAICQVYLEDQDEGKSYITLTTDKLLNASPDASMEIEGNNRVFTVPIASNFLDRLNKQSVAGIGISINSKLVQGKHSCIIQQIHLLK